MSEVPLYGPEIMGRKEPGRSLQDMLGTVHRERAPKN